MKKAYQDRHNEFECILCEKMLIIKSKNKQFRRLYVLNMGLGKHKSNVDEI